MSSVLHLNPYGIKVKGILSPDYSFNLLNNVLLPSSLAAAAAAAEIFSELSVIFLASPPSPLSAFIIVLSGRRRKTWPICFLASPTPCLRMYVESGVGAYMCIYIFHKIKVLFSAHIPMFQAFLKQLSGVMLTRAKTQQLANLLFSLAIVAWKTAASRYFHLH